MQDTIFTYSGLLVPALASGFVLSAVATWINKLLKQYTGLILALLPLSLFLYFASLLPGVAHGTIYGADIAWVPSLNVNLSFMVDGWGLFMSLIVTGIGTLVFVYASSYLKGHPEIGRFYTFLLLFMAAMLVLVLANNIFLMFIGWELTSISSFFLIGYYHNQEKSQKSALQALLVTGAGGLAMLAGLVLLFMIVGSAEFSVILQSAELIQSSPLFVPTLILILLGAFTKSAQFPFHFWLPNAMAGPAPVSTYLHSATMVKAGIYLLARLTPAMGGNDIWLYTLVIIGGITAVMGAWLSWQNTDLKGILAYSTISALGTLVFLIGLGTEIALETAVLFLLVHALYKAALFMSAGIVDHEVGTRDVRELGGLVKYMPFTFTAVVLATLSMSGIPPMLGFISKELMYESTLEFEGPALLLTAVLLVTNIFMVTASGVLAIGPFLGKETEHHPHHKTPVAMWIGPVLLGVTALLLGLFSSSHFVNETLLAPAVSAVEGKTAHPHLALWHGLTPMLLLSVVTVASGLGVWAFHKQLRPAANRVSDAVSRIGPARWYDWVLNGTLKLADVVTNIVQNGYLRWYLTYVVATLAVLVGGTLIFRAAVPWLSPAIGSLRIYELLLAGMIVAATYMAVSVESRLSAVMALGVIGYGMAMLFVLFGAPDLAMTQFSIETLTVILFVLVLYRLPAFDRFSSKSARTRDAVIAIIFGTLMAGLVYAVKSIQEPGLPTLSQWFSENTYELAHGHNIVNVILVDFRGMDTMFEITVLSVAAIGVYALLKSRPQRRPQEQGPSPYLTSETSEEKES